MIKKLFARYVFDLVKQYKLWFVLVEFSSMSENVMQQLKTLKKWKWCNSVVGIGHFFVKHEMKFRLFTMIYCRESAVSF